VEPGTDRLIHLKAGAETKVEGEIQITWQDECDSSNAPVTLDAFVDGSSQLCTRNRLAK